MNRIDAGHTGILFNHYGVTDKKGVSDRAVVSGTVFYNPFTRSVYEYPHYWQDAEYEGISFNSLEGEPISCNMKVVFRYVRDSIPLTFDEYRQSPSDLRDGIIETIVLEALSAEAGKMSAVDIMGQRREMLLEHTTSLLNETFGDRFEFKLVAFTDKLSPSENVIKAVQSVIQAQEKAKSAQAKTVEVEESARQKIITAKSDSASIVIRASAAAKEISLIQAELSRFPTYNDYVRSKRWDGKLPIYQGAATPFIQVN